MHFRIRALAGAAAIHELELAAPDAAAARRLAVAQGLAVMSVTPVDGKAAGGRFPLQLFNQELLALLVAGIPLAEALAALAEKETRAGVREVLLGLGEGLREGRTLSLALAARPQAFPDLYVATIRAAERTSDLVQALARYIDYQRQLALVRGKLVSAAVYPALLLLVGGAVMLFLLLFVVPRFAQVFESVGGELPWMSQLLLQWGQLMQAHAPLVGGGVLALITAAVAILRRPATHGAALRLAWRLPRVGERLRVFELARFYRTLGMLLRGGIPAVTAMGMVEGLLSPVLRPGLQASIAQVREGKGLAATLQANGLATPVALRMVAVGERAGNLGEMLERAAEFHEEESARWLDVLTRLAGPLLMLVIAVAVGLILIMLYLPIFQVAESIQ
ncbi:MAG: type II secretion system F family protein [Zoogloea sp.]|uniref:type II secretion system F family protein n=1 Tax=Zoogloea sp. TaxID=49181 RepID=UPI002603C0CF|nr:type II secretion system F family protein [Zoogloea sp.]MDD2987529.1 type II secretion system F family protein [Zoogloea sp.]